MRELCAEGLRPASGRLESWWDSAICGRRPAPGPRRASARLALLAASLLLLLSAPFAAPAQAQSHCDSSDIREVWCATMTVGERSST